MRDLYTISDDADKLSDEIAPDFYGPVDDNLGRILQEILDVLDGGGVPQFSQEALIDRKRGVIELVKRTPDLHGADDTRLKQLGR